MPLKHSTETLLVGLLGGMIVVCGAVLAALPPLSFSVWPWVALFSATLAYPIAVYPLLKSRRADYAFRVLHAYPAVLALVWLALAFAGGMHPALETASRVFSWGWSAAGVVVGLLLLLLFSLQVIRQRARRGAVLGALAAVVVAAAVLGEHADAPERTRLFFARAIDPAFTIADAPNLAFSDHEAEESWRMSLRRMARREERLKEQERPDAAATIASVSSQAQSQPIIAVLPAPLQFQPTPAVTVTPELPERPIVDAPPRLSGTGPGVYAVLVLFGALYCAVLHDRARRRTHIV